MKHKLLFVLISLFVVSCYDDRELRTSLDELSNRLDNLADIQIKSMDDQLISVKGSLSDLKNVDELLMKLLDDLDLKMTEMQQELNDNADSEDAVKKAMDEIAGLKNLIKALQDNDQDLDEKIEHLKTYADAGISETMDWAETTFATLEQYSEIQSSISDISALIDQYQEDISAAYLKSITEAIVASEESMKEWVNVTLAEGYYNVAQIDGKIGALEMLLIEGDLTLHEELETLKSSIDQAKSDLKASYGEAITESISTNNGIIRGEIAESVKAAQNILQSQIEAINTEILSIKSRLTDVESQLKTILGMIQSVAYIPQYSDGAAYVDPVTESVDLIFKISPSSAVSALADVWEDALSVKYVLTATTKALPDIKDLAISSVEFDFDYGMMSLTIDCSALNTSFFAGSNSASVALFISDGSNNVSSEFVPLVLMHAEDLSVSGTANSYIVDETGTYKFKAVKGNSAEPVGAMSYAEVLWESFGTNIAPQTGDLIEDVNNSGSYIVFKTPATFQEGNAVIAAKDSEGKVLWSWHVWLTDEPQPQVYNNNAGIMMDRNLGATSATHDDVCALGLLYQWGRKDPFLGSSSVGDLIDAKSTITWPEAVESTEFTGTIDYVTANPTTYVYEASAAKSGFDWHYSFRNNDLWKSDKTIYDPCPVGWRVPDGGENGVWKIAGFEDDHYAGDDGFFFKIASPSYSWYPAAGCRGSVDDKLYSVGRTLRYWSVTTNDRYASRLFVFTSGNGFQSSNFAPRVCASSVRCFRESL